jgi:hypothetical protein
MVGWGVFTLCVRGFVQSSNYGETKSSWLKLLLVYTTNV